MLAVKLLYTRVQKCIQSNESLGRSNERAGHGTPRCFICHAALLVPRDAGQRLRLHHAEGHQAITQLQSKLSASG